MYRNREHVQKVIGECLRAACKGPFFVWNLRVQNPDKPEEDKAWLAQGRRRRLVTKHRFELTGAEDWSEFSTIFSLSQPEVEHIADSWPNIPTDENVERAINNSFNNLLGYPHHCDDLWSEYISVSQAELADIYRQWRKSSAAGPPKEGDSPSQAYFYRML